jgi:hypothetical protein
VKTMLMLIDAGTMDPIFKVQFLNNIYLIQCIVYVTDNFQLCDLVFPLCTLMDGETKANLEAL